MSDIQLPGPLVDVAWLTRNANDPRLVVLDCSWHMPQFERDAGREFEQGHIPGSRFFDFDRRIADPDSELPHMLPDAARFQREVRALGVNRDALVVCYDTAGIMTAPRGWWMFRCFGHASVAVLDGGLPAWQAAGGAVQVGPASAVSEGGFEAVFDPLWVRDLAAVADNVTSKAERVVDARSRGRFDASEPEPREGLRGGHIPGSVSLPFPELLDGGRYRSPEAIAGIFAANGLARDEPLVFTCGSGVTACILALGAQLAGHETLAVYDGSWSEWGASPDVPVATGRGAA